MKNLHFSFLLAMLFCSLSGLRATNPISLEAHSLETSTDLKQGSEGIFAKAKVWIKKKMISVFDTEKAKQFGLLALILGLVSLTGLILSPLFFAGWALLLIAVLALAGDIVAGLTLWNTRENKAENKLARRMAWWGLILSLLTGLIPLGLLVLVIATI